MLKGFRVQEKIKTKIEPARNFFSGVKDCPDTVNQAQGTVSRCYRGSGFRTKVRPILNQQGVGFLGSETA